VSNQDSLYFMQRAEVEIALAQRAEHPEAVAAHYFLAQSYLDLVYGDGSKEAAEVRPN
jgi:hypothetical protein